MPWSYDGLAANPPAIVAKENAPTIVYVAIDAHRLRKWTSPDLHKLMRWVDRLNSLNRDDATGLVADIEAGRVP